MYTLNLTEPFIEDLNSSVKYIRQELKAPVAAKRLKKEVVKTYKNIKKDPYVYPRVHDDYLASKGFRFKVIRNFMLFFTIDNNIINIIRFLYGPKDWANILKDI